MKVQSKLLLYAFAPAPGASVVGACFVHTIKHFDNLYITLIVLFGAPLISDFFWTRRTVQRLAYAEGAKKHATQFLWSCLFFSMLWFGLGVALASVVWIGADLTRRFSLIFWAALSIIAIYPVFRDANRLAETLSLSRG